MDGAVSLLFKNTNRQQQEEGKSDDKSISEL